VIGGIVIVASWLHEYYLDQHFGRPARAMEAFLKRLVLCSPYVEEADQQLCITAVRFEPSGVGGGRLYASAPAAFPNQEFAAQIQARTHSQVIAVVRLPHHFAPADDPSDGRYERESDWTGTARVPLAQGASEAETNSFMCIMNGDGCPPGTYQFLFNDTQHWCLMPYGEHSHAGGSVAGFTITHGSGEIDVHQIMNIRHIMTSPDNFSKAIPVVIEVFVTLGDNGPALATDGTMAAGSDASGGITEIMFIKRTSPDASAPFRFIDHEAAVAAGIVEVQVAQGSADEAFAV
jgi:hypothetical protein